MFAEVLSHDLNLVPTVSRDISVCLKIPVIDWSTRLLVIYHHQTPLSTNDCDFESISIFEQELEFDRRGLELNNKKLYWLELREVFDGS